MTDADAAVQPVPADRLYTEDHIWVMLDGAMATVGVTVFGADLLGEVVYLDLPEPGTELEANEPFGAIESVKTVYELALPIAGVVLERNDAAVVDPGMVNDSPYDAWLIRITVRDEESGPYALLSPEEYQASMRRADGDS